MKKIILFFIIFYTTISISQENKFQLGINAGATLSDFRGNVLLDESNASFGFLVGINFQYHFKEKLSFISNINYTRKTFKQNFEVNNIFFNDPVIFSNSIDFEFNYNYLEIPLLIKYKFSKANGFYINGGLLLVSF